LSAAIFSSFAKAAIRSFVARLTNERLPAARPQTMKRMKAIFRMSFIGHPPCGPGSRRNASAARTSIMGEQTFMKRMA